MLPPHITFDATPLGQPDTQCQDTTPWNRIHASHVCPYRRPNRTSKSPLTPHYHMWCTSSPSAAQYNGTTTPSCCAKTGKSCHANWKTGENHATFLAPERARENTSDKVTRRALTRSNADAVAHYASYCHTVAEPTPTNSSTRTRRPTTKCGPTKSRALHPACLLLWVSPSSQVAGLVTRTNPTPPAGGG